MSEILLDVQHLSHVFKLGKHAVIKAVDDVSFQMKKGEIFGLVGESGSGKSTVARCIMNIYKPTAGKIVEIGTAEEVYYDPRHPYTWGLMQSLPALNKGAKELKTIPGMPPTLIDPPVGDAFACRNEYALEIDYHQQPPMFQITDTHYAATWLLDPRAPKVESPMGGKCNV